ncbi:GNAT family N-acetyltransferase [Maribacter sp. 4G9]|uniref:GNAT family N-acetyltransferase n=1 Tax=Maribacter sp. 4G9 TaxID=1889777 RepID=UPI000C162072|nr:GNAT family N-acetyltransferase [Maribacter sp. 4G9]PIB27512.1 hypothetical protein BFP75_00325 [Maribacter sp. 4G9]
MGLEARLKFIKLVPSLYDRYIHIGTMAYNQHYRHLWPNGDTTTYIQHSFTKQVLLNEELDINTHLFIIQLDATYVGILKVTLHKSILSFTESEAIYLDKIYILKEFSGLGIGARCIQFVEDMARKLSKRVLFLESMQKGRALGFYLANGFTIVANSTVPFENVIEEEKPMYLLKKDLP